MPEEHADGLATGRPAEGVPAQGGPEGRRDADVRTIEICLRLATEAAGLGVFEWDARADAVHWGNDRMYEIFGRSRERGPIGAAEYAGEVSHPDDAGRYREALDAAARTGEFSFSGRFRRGDGELRWVEMMGRMMHAEDGTPLRMAGIVADVSDRHASQLQSEMLAAIVASSDDAIVSKDLRGVITSWNQAAERIFGYTAAEIVGRHISTLIPPGHDEDVVHILSKIRRGERVDHFETKRRTKDGRILDLSITVSPIRNAAGDIVGASKVARDVTERNRARAALRESEEQLRQITDVLPQQIWTARPDGGLDYVNARAREYAGDAASRDGAPRWAEVIHPDDRDASAEAWRRSVATGDPYEVEQRLRHAGTGAFRWHLCRARPVRDASGRIIKWYGTNTDIDDRRRWEAAVREARDEAERANRMKDEFLATLSHELRTPLNAILGWAKILTSGRVGEEHSREGLAAIERNAVAQVQIIEDLLDISRIVSGNFRLEVQRVRIQDVVEAAVASAMPAAMAKGVRLHKMIDSLAGPVSGDAARLQQVVWNLLANAVKFTPKGGTVQVLLERVNSHLEIGVVDTGIGMSPDFLPHVFDRFRQAESGTTRRHGGLGLGLAIVKQLVELHGGTVRAKSPGEGAGSTFIVSLPIAVVHPEEAGPAGLMPASPGDEAGRDRLLEGVKVLVVDDEPDARQLIHRVLADRGAEVARAASARDGLALVESFGPDVIVSDVGMPEQNGYDFLRQVRARRSPAELPAAALTAFARAEDRRQALLAGFQTHVAKPVDPAELVAVVASLAGRTQTV
ncbi:Autoinducer 2 sensor kinase/phosphatase LuxQ [Aquisphaera giovannonii]|uniref:histidine kinase n=1 Tax=Aquisphaera giovannonii TaxID=406548 RepID=A0A5B9VV18_9BACT|nr:PAS domain S-box protein [Aquisphaera giovannonii]QEH31575.1 Autoinducer 2 sensor kinase/phosphatase LuxQ [Aquisphaera giovannonii]